MVFSSCQRSDLKEEIAGVWICPWQFFFNPDTIKFDSPYYPNSPFLLDFKNKNELTLKIFGDSTYNFKYSLHNDSIIRVDENDLYILSIINDTLTLIYETDTSKLYRINTPILLDSVSVFNILCTNIWSDTNLHPQEIRILGSEDYIEYLPAGIRIKKYQFEKGNSHESDINIELWRWALDKYNDYYFLFDCLHQLGGTLPYDNIHQITEISDSILKYFGPHYYPPCELSYYGFQPLNKAESIKQKLLGEWVSENSTNKSYGNYIPKRLIKSGITSLYEGPFYYKITKDSLLQYGINTAKLTSNWFLNKDETILFYDFEMISNYESGQMREHQFELSEIKRFSDSSFTIVLYLSLIPSGTIKPIEYYLNLKQDFVKIK